MLDNWYFNFIVMLNSFLQRSPSDSIFSTHQIPIPIESGRNDINKFYFTIAILIVVEMQPVRADTLARPADNTAVNDSVLYQPLTNAVPQRNITRQQFAPPAPTHQ